MPIRKNFISLKQHCEDNNKLYLLEQWDKDSNREKGPKDYSYGSEAKVNWICSLGHRWKASINQRCNSGTGCPYCSNNKVLIGFNDLNTTNPKIAAEWHPTKNIPLTPYEVTSGSNKKVWWKCSKDHEWQVSINDRNTYNLGCPYCSNKKVLAGYNDLSSTNPTLASEWHPTKNKSLTPCNVTQGSKKKVWWKCSKGHEWEAAICDRYLGSNCPTCQNENHVSFSEKAIYFYIKKLFDDTVENFKFQDIKNMELDVYVPSLNLGIEFDGAYYHTDLARDIKKYKACKNKGIKLIRVREAGCKQSNEIADVVINVKSTDYADLT